jgi:hypothetical protein
MLFFGSHIVVLLEETKTAHTATGGRYPEASEASHTAATGRFSMILRCCVVRTISPKSLLIRTVSTGTDVPSVRCNLQEASQAATIWGWR